MNKSRLIGALCAAVFSLTSLSSHAALMGRDLDGNLTTAEAYYDDQLDITWAQDANINGPMNWTAANAWAAGLTIAGVSGWRLPNMDKNNDDTIVKCSSGTQAACADNEYGHLFYYGAGTTLGGGVTSTNPGPFSNVQTSLYWSSTEYAPNPNDAWNVRSNNGHQYFLNKNHNLYSWAVQSGNVGAVTDLDNDGVLDNADNCINVANAGQQDTDGDGHGNICDADFDFNCVVDFTDLSLFKAVFFTENPLFDLNSSGGAVDFTDLALFKGLFFQQPGPSAAGICP